MHTRLFTIKVAGFPNRRWFPDEGARDIAAKIIDGMALECQTIDVPHDPVELAKFLNNPD